jgi:phage-related protein
MPVTLTLPKNPSQSGYSEAQEPKVLIAQFSDGYEQRVQDGFNNILIVVSITLDNITVAEKNTLQAFFFARGGWDAFYYTLVNESTPRLWTCKKGITFSGSQANLYNATFQLEEVADLA